MANETQNEKDFRHDYIKLCQRYDLFLYPDDPFIALELISLEDARKKDIDWSMSQLPNELQ